jgi:hypothetical protein
VRSGSSGTSGPIDRFARPGIAFTLMFGQIMWNWPWPSPSREGAK